LLPFGQDIHNERLISNKGLEVGHNIHLLILESKKGRFDSHYFRPFAFLA